jgi:HEAT repeat protein
MVDPIRALKLDTDEDRITACRWFAENPTPDAYEHLLVAMGSSNPDLICWAAWALARFGNPDALEPMRRAIVRYCEQFAQTHNAGNKPYLPACLELLMRSASTATLIELLQQVDNHGGMRVDAAKILGKRKVSEAFSALAQMLRDGWHAYSVTAAEALIQIDPLDALPHLEQVYADCKEVCASGHLDSDGKRLVGILIALLKVATKDILDTFLCTGSELERWYAQRELAQRIV